MDGRASAEQSRRGKPIVIPAERRGKQRVGKAVRMVIDVAFATVFITLMSTAMVREVAHEYLGIAAFCLFVVHQVLNRRWWTGLVRGRWTARRAIGTLVNVALVACMIGQATSALVLSKYAFGWLPAIDGAWWARIVHLLCSYWGLVLLGIHVGLHLGGVSRKLAKSSTGMRWAWRALGLVCIVLGVAAFAHLNFASYLFMQVKFVFVDPTAPLWFTVAQFAAVAALFAVAGNLLQACLRPRKTPLNETS